MKSSAAPSSPSPSSDSEWFAGWARVMLEMQDRPPPPPPVEAPAAPRRLTRTQMWLEAKAARMQKLQATRPPVEVRWRPESDATEPGKHYPCTATEETTEDQLRAAMRAFGHTGASKAHRRLGTDLFRAIEQLGDSWNWAWLCQQPMARLGWIADRLDRKLGRRPAEAWRKEQLPLTRDPFGGGEYGRNLTEEPPQFEPPASARAILCSELRGRVAGYDYWVEELTQYRLTCGDWRRIVGQGLKLLEQGQLKYSLQSWLKHVARAEAEGYQRSARPEEDPEA